MNIKRNPISARDMVFFIITTPFKGDIVIASARLSVCMLCSILLNHWKKSDKVWCARFSYEWGVRQQIFWPSYCAPGRVQRSTIIFEKSNSKNFIPNFMFVLKNKRNGIFIMSPGSYSRGWDLGLLEVNFFSKLGRVAYQIEGDGEQNGIQVKCSPYGQICDLEV